MSQMKDYVKRSVCALVAILITNSLANLSAFETLNSQEKEMKARWIAAKFDGKETPVAKPETCLEVVANHDPVFLDNRAGKKLKIGGKLYDRGLYCHAPSHLNVYLPKPAKRFMGAVGIDTNAEQTAAGNGSVHFRVNANKREIFASDLLRGAQDAVEFELPLNGAQDFSLIIDDGGDGISCDQSDWADARVELEDGSILYLSDLDLVDSGRYDRTLDLGFPFSFVYDGKSSSEFLNEWNLERSVSDVVDGKVERVLTFTEPNGRLQARCRVVDYVDYPFVEWTVDFKNLSDEDSPIIENVKPIDMIVGRDFFERRPHSGWDPDCGDADRWNLEHEFKLHYSKGSPFSPDDYMPYTQLMEPGVVKDVATRGGRATGAFMPYFNLESNKKGWIIVLGWSGQWSATFKNARESRSLVTVSAGMEKIATVLRPGETIRSPRALVMPWRGDVLQSHALFRRLLMFECVPKVDDKPVPMEIVAQCFDRYYRKRAGWERVDAQIESARKLKDVGGTAYWFDAAWFPVGFPNGVGNWYSDPTNFPNGVEELGAALKEMGLKFILWFEPERVAPDTQIAKERPEFVFGGSQGGLYKLNDPEARQYLGDLLVKRVKEFGIDVYRNDFNIDPAPYWRDADEENRIGMTEIRYVEGHYELWNRIRTAKPGLWIDNCASGGRRIDLETISISVPLWRSDTCCWAGHPEWDQSHTLGLARFLPLYSCSSWDPSPYTFRSAANPGAIMQYNFLDDDYDREATMASVREAKTYQKFWYGDFYPLSSAASGKHNDVVWQLHRPDLDAGLVYFFRQPDSPYPQYETKLRAIDPDATYRVVVKANSYAPAPPTTISGRALQTYRLESPQRGSATVIEYEKIK